MLRKILHYLLNLPFIYILVQHILAPGSRKLVEKQIRTTRRSLSTGGLILDIGCGPESLLWQTDLHPIGFDITFSYCSAFYQKSEPSVNGSATRLPFPADMFNEVWSIGMFHHLSDSMTIEAISEMVRVCKRGGAIVIFDAVLPKNPWLLPHAYLIRKADRGRFVRTQKIFENLLPNRSEWSIKRVLYSFSGLEIMVCVLTKP